jgi:hypothetical protein
MAFSFCPFCIQFKKFKRRIQYRLFLEVQRLAPAFSPQHPTFLSTASRLRASAVVSRAFELRCSVWLNTPAPDGHDCPFQPSSSAHVRVGSRRAFRRLTFAAGQAPSAPHGSDRPFLTAGLVVDPAPASLFAPPSASPGIDHGRTGPTHEFKRRVSCTSYSFSC